MMNPLSLVMHQILQKPNVRRYVRFGEVTSPISSVSKAYDSEDLKLNAALVLDVEKGISIKRLEGSMRTRVTQQSSSIIFLGGYEHEKLRQTRYWRNPPSITSIYDIRSCQK